MEILQFAKDQKNSNESLLTSAPFFISIESGLLPEPAETNVWTMTQASE